MRDPKATAEELASKPLVDDGLLKEGGRLEVLAALRRWNEKGLRGLVVCSREVDGAFAKALWRELSASEKSDLVLIYDGKAFHARGWGLDEPRLQKALADAQPSLRMYAGRGIHDALDALGNAALAARGGENGASETAAASPSTKSGALVGGLVGVGVLGVVAFVIARRNTAFREQKEKFTRAKASAEKAFSEAVLDADKLDGEVGTRLQLRAGELKARIDAVAERAEKDQTRYRDPVAVGELEQIENEIAALRSESLQQGRR